MNINELTGVKQYKDMQLPDLITKVMADNGFEKLGAGSFGVAYKRPKDDYVYKLFVEDSAYAKFIEYSMKNPSAYFPRVDGYKSLSAFWKRAPRQLDERLYVAKVEFIMVGRSLQHEFQVIADHIYSIFSGIEYWLSKDSTTEEIESYIIDAIADYEIEGISPALVNKLVDFIDTIRNFSGATDIDFPAAVDIHPGNIGFRKNGEWVLVDPVFDGKEMSTNNYHHPTGRDIIDDPEER
jgi:hypothetical protein